MRQKMLKRVAALTCSVCMCYGLGYQALHGGEDAALEPAFALEEPVTEQPTQQPTESITAGENPDSGEAPRRRGHGGGRRWRENDTAPEGWQAPDTTPEAGTEEDVEEEKKRQQDTQDEEEDQSSARNASGDPPTLSAFLSTLRCGGCRHGCSLLNPRCMKGRSKAERAAVEYEQTYGSDNT